MNRQQATAVTNPVRATGVDVRRVPALRGDGPELSEALDVHDIAGLSDVTVARMTRDELVRVICAADLPLPTGYDADRLRLQNQSTLARLAFLARLACRNRVTIRAWRCGITSRSLFMGGGFHGPLGRARCTRHAEQDDCRKFRHARFALTSRTSESAQHVPAVCDSGALFWGPSPPDVHQTTSLLSGELSVNTESHFSAWRGNVVRGCATSVADVHTNHIKEIHRMFVPHRERHRTERIGWLRAAVLGANDGIVSTASLVVGVAAAHSTAGDILVAGVAGLVAGAMSMAAGEYVSVSSQADTEQADLDRERKELAAAGDSERNELAAIYASRGVEPSLARQVADQLMARDALAAHARDELGISEISTAKPIQAALASAGTFAVGAAMPLLTVLLTPSAALIPVVIAISILFLALLGGFGARAGGAPVMKAAFRVTFWGALAMALTAGVGALFGAVV